MHYLKCAKRHDNVLVLSTNSGLNVVNNCSTNWVLRYRNTYLKSTTKKKRNLGTEIRVASNNKNWKDYRFLIHFLQQRKKSKQLLCLLLQVPMARYHN